MSVQRSCSRDRRLDDGGAVHDAFKAGPLVVRDGGRAVLGTLLVVDRFGDPCWDADLGARVHRNRYAQDIFLRGKGHPVPRAAGIGQVRVHDTRRAATVKIPAALRRGASNTAENPRHVALRMTPCAHVLPYNNGDEWKDGCYRYSSSVTCSPHVALVPASSTSSIAR